MNKIIFVLIAVLVLVGIGYGIYNQINRQKDVIVTSYTKCVAAGYPVLTSYPPQCRTPDGRSFTQDIGNELEYIDQITVSSPRPTSKVQSPLIIKGQARGGWYSEGTFSMELVDASGKSLGTANASAEGEWMTNDFVPFTATIEFSKLQTGNGQLKISNANPSGLPENTKTLIIPIEF